MWDLRITKGDIHKLPFSHGIEAEYFIVDNDGFLTERDKEAKIFQELARKAHEKISYLFNSGMIPVTISRKIKDITVAHVHKKGDVLKITYEFSNKKEVTVDVIGRDANLYNANVIGRDSKLYSASVNLIELVTPPTETLYELAWWMAFLLRITQETIDDITRKDTNESGLNLMAIGAYPWQEKGNWITCGDHHHIGIEDQEVRIAAYNILRNYDPYIIALTTNSPFVNGRTENDEYLSIRNGYFVAGNVIRSYRLKYNTSQLGPTTGYFLPYLKEYDPSYFVKYLRRRDINDARFVDIFPFTRYNTIEIRFVDAQSTVLRKVSVAMLMQLLALKAKNMLEDGKVIPEIPSTALYDLRTAVIWRGLFQTFNIFKMKHREIYMKYKSINEEFVESYFKILLDSTPSNDRMSFAIREMFHFLTPEIKELELESSFFLGYLLLLLEKNKGLGMSPADLLLKKYFEFNKDMKRLGKYLVELTRKSIDPWFDPILTEKEIILHDLLKEKYPYMIRYIQI